MSSMLIIQALGLGLLISGIESNDLILKIIYII